MRVRVGLYYEVMGYVEIEAKDEKSGEKKVLKIMETDGIEALGALDTTYREYHVIESKRVPSVMSGEKDAG